MIEGMDKEPSVITLPQTHVLTDAEIAFVNSLDAQHKELHKLAIEWLETSYRPEWSHMWKKSSK